MKNRDRLTWPGHDDSLAVWHDKLLNRVSAHILNNKQSIFLTDRVYYNIYV